MNVLKLSVYGIELVSVDAEQGKGVTITSDLKDGVDAADVATNAAIDAIESMVMSHYAAGVRVNSPAYLEGLEVAVESIFNNEPGADTVKVKRTLFEELSISDSLSIDDSTVRHFNVFEFDPDSLTLEDVCLDAGDYQFTFNEIEGATKTGATWFVSKDGSEYQITCEKIAYIE